MRALIGVAAALALLAAPARAQDYPRRTIRILEPLAAGSAVDVVTRIVADKRPADQSRRHPQPDRGCDRAVGQLDTL